MKDKKEVKKIAIFTAIGTVCGISLGYGLAMLLKSDELKDIGIAEIADDIREFGHAQIWCSDGEPVCIRRE